MSELRGKEKWIGSMRDEVAIEYHPRLSLHVRANLHIMSIDQARRIDDTKQFIMLHCGQLRTYLRQHCEVFDDSDFLAFWSFGWADVPELSIMQKTKFDDFAGAVQRHRDSAKVRKSGEVASVSLEHLADSASDGFSAFGGAPLAGVECVSE